MMELTSVFQAPDLLALPKFPERRDQLAIVSRRTPEGAEAFFNELMRTPFGIAGKVRKEDAAEDIKKILKKEISVNLRSTPFYDLWVADMAEVCQSFCETQGSEAAGFWLGSERGCRRYHVDNVPLRALVTYAGQGTEWLPDEAADRTAFASGAPNEKIIKDPSAIRFMKAWDVAVFRGGPQGLLHRTPDAALNGPSILMRLDHPSFWDKVMKYQSAGL